MVKCAFFTGFAVSEGRYGLRLRPRPGQGRPKAVASFSVPASSEAATNQQEATMTDVDVVLTVLAVLALLILFSLVRLVL